MTTIGILTEIELYVAIDDSGFYGSNVNQYYDDFWKYKDCSSPAWTQSMENLAVSFESPRTKKKPEDGQIASLVFASLEILVVLISLCSFYIMIYNDRKTKFYQNF